MMERPDPVHQAAPNPSIAQGRKPYNPVKRVGAFSEVQAEKAALVEGCAPTLCGKITLHKEPHPLSRDGYRGGLSPAMVFPPLPTPRRMARGYLRQTPCSRRHRPAGSPQTGAGIGRVSRSAQLGIAGKHDRECRMGSRLSCSRHGP